MKETYLNFKLNKAMEQHLEKSVEKFGMSRSEIGRRALWMYFDNHLTFDEMNKTGMKYVINTEITNILKENGVI